jgi:hypothetical protein
MSRMRDGKQLNINQSMVEEDEESRIQAAGM